VFLGAFCWGLSGGIGGLLLNNEWDPALLTFVRGFIGLLFVLPSFVFAPEKDHPHPPCFWAWSTLAGLGIAGNFSFYYFSISAGSVAVASTLMYSAPVFVLLASIGLGQERPTLKNILAILFVILGIVMLTRVYALGTVEITPWGTASGLLAGLSYALFIFAFHKALHYGSPHTSLAVAFAVVTGVLVFFLDPGRLPAVWQSGDVILFLLLGLLGGGISFWLYVRGLRGLPPVFASLAALVEPVTAVLFGVLLLGERLALPQLLGLSLILVTVTSLSLDSSHHDAHETP
jgi:drug/metabolite transporter (DMT)-like permease